MQQSTAHMGMLSSSTGSTSMRLSKDSWSAAGAKLKQLVQDRINLLCSRNQSKISFSQHVGQHVHISNASASDESASAEHVARPGWQVPHARTVWHCHQPVSASSISTSNVISLTTSIKLAPLSGNPGAPRGSWMSHDRSDGRFTWCNELC